MSKIDDGGPAFPVECSWSGTGIEGIQTGNATGFATGLSVLDYFAANAQQSVCATKVEGLGWKLVGDRAYGEARWITNAEMQAEAAYRIAGAMLAEKRKREAGA